MKVFEQNPFDFEDRAGMAVEFGVLGRHLDLADNVVHLGAGQLDNPVAPLRQVAGPVLLRQGADHVVVADPRGAIGRQHRREER